MHWNYRIVHFETDIGDYYDLHEVYYDEDGTPFARTSDGKAYGETVEEVIEVLEMMLSDAKKAPVLEDKDIKHERFDEIEARSGVDGAGAV
ncbi:MAG: hypothetical protein WDA59_01745 [Methanofastidiosum sp.]|jgi:hypothetical protein